MNNVTTVGIDLAKNAFAVHGVDALGRVVLRRTVRREKLCELIAQLPLCLIGMEACSGAPAWARQFAKLGHTEATAAETARSMSTCPRSADLLRRH